MRMIWAELRGIWVGAVVALAANAVLLLIMPFIAVTPGPEHSIIFIGSLIPFFWVLILFESFRPLPEQFGFIVGMPAGVSRTFWIRLAIRCTIVLAMTAVSWYFLDFRHYFAAKSDIEPWLLWAVLVAVTVFLAQVCRGMELCVIAVVAYPLLILNQLPVQLLYMAFVSGGGHLLAALQIILLLLFAARHIWRARCLNRNLRRVIMPWILFLAVLPWLEYGISAGYFYLDYHLALSKAARSGVMIVPDELARKIHDPRNHVERSDAECAEITAELLAFYGYKSGDTPFLQAIAPYDTVRSYLKKQIKKCYAEGDAAGFIEYFRIHNYLCGYNSLLLDRLSYEEVKPELYRAMIRELEKILDQRLAPKMGVALDSPVYWYLPRRHIDQNNYYWTNYKGLLEVIQPGIRARLIREAIFYLEYYEKYQSYPPWPPWEVDIRPDGYWHPPYIRRNIVTLSLRLYAHEHGGYPEELPPGLRERLEYPFLYRKTLNGFEIRYGKYNDVYKGIYYTYPRREDMSW